MKAKIQAFSQTDPDTLRGINTASGEKVCVMLEGPDAAVERIVNLGLRPVLADEDGLVVRWYDPAGAGPAFDELGGFADLFADVSATILEGERPVYKAGPDLERRQ